MFFSDLLESCTRFERLYLTLAEYLTENHWLWMLISAIIDFYVIHISLQLIKELFLNWLEDLHNFGTRVFDLLGDIRLLFLLIGIFVFCLIRKLFLFCWRFLLILSAKWNDLRRVISTLCICLVTCINISKRNQNLVFWLVFLFFLHRRPRSSER